MVYVAELSLQVALLMLLVQSSSGLRNHSRQKRQFFNSIDTDVQACAGMDLVFLLDYSGEMRYPESALGFEEFMKNLFHNYAIGHSSSQTQIALIKYDEKAVLEFPLSSTPEEKNKKIKQIVFDSATSPEPPPPGERITNTSGGLLVARDIFTATKGDRQYAKNVLLLITDNPPTVNTEMMASKIAREAEADGIVIAVIGIGKHSLQDEIKAIASDKDLFTSVSAFHNLLSLKEDILTKVCRWEFPAIYTFPMDRISGNTIQSSDVIGTVKFPAVYQQAILMEGLVFDGNQSVNFGDVYRRRCFGNIEYCTGGMMYAFWVYIDGSRGGGKIYKGDGIQGYFILSNGGQTSDSWGIAMSYIGFNLYLIAQNWNSQWGPLHYTASEEGWYYISFTWSISQGLTLYINGYKHSTAALKKRIQVILTPSLYVQFYLGRPNDYSGGYANMILDEFNFVNRIQTDKWIFNKYLTYQRSTDDLTPKKPPYIPVNYYFSMDIYADILIITGNKISAALCHTPDLVQGIVNKGLMFDGSQCINFGNQFLSECFGNIELCYYGYTYSFWIYLYGTDGRGSPYSGDGIQGYFILSSGGQSSRSWGVGVSYQGLLIRVIAQTRRLLWGPIQYRAPSPGWLFISQTWDPLLGLFLYINGKLVQSATAQTRMSPSGSGPKSFYLGRPNDVDGSYGTIVIDEFNFLNKYLSADMIYRQFQMYSTPTQLPPTSPYTISIKARTTTTTTTTTNLLTRRTPAPGTQGPRGNCDLIDLVLLLDSSGSIGRSNWQTMIDFVGTMVDSMQIDQQHTQVGILTFGTRARVEFHLNEYETRNSIHEAILGIQYKDEETNTSGGLWTMREIMFTREHGDRSRTPNIAVVLTDGASSRDAHLTVQYAEEARAEGITILAAGIGNGVDASELLGIAGSPDKVINVSSFDALSTIQTQIRKFSCNLLKACTKFLDLAIVLDSSSSIGQGNYDIVKNFLKEQMNSINVGYEKSRIAMVTFSGKPQVQFLLNEFDSRINVQKAIDEIPYYRGSTNTAEALKLLYTTVFTKSNGDRQKIPNIALLITDGGSNVYDDTIEEAKKVKASGITILVVAITSWVKNIEIYDVASDPDNTNVLFVDKFVNLGRISRSLEAALCDEVDECAISPCASGGKCIEGINRFTCACPSSLAGRVCDISCNGKVDLVFVVDSSGSITEVNFVMVMEFVKKVIDNVNPASTQVGLLSFSTEATVRFHLNEYRTKQEMTDGTSIPYKGGTTNTAQALQFVTNRMFMPENGDRQDARNIAIVITDGRSNNKLETYTRAMEARAAGILLLVVSIGLADDVWAQSELAMIASDPNEGNVFSVDYFNQLNGITTRLVHSLCNSINECQSDPCQSGGTCMDGINTYSCTCATGFSGTNCERSCEATLDLAFLVDGSGSIRPERFLQIQNFMINVLNEWDIGPDTMRVGLVLFSDVASIIFKLNTFNNKEDVLQNIRNMPYLGGKTYTGDALKKVQDVFSVENGDRPHVSSIGIVITDGESNINPEETLKEAIRTKMQGAHLMVVAVGINTPNLEVKGIASEPDSANILTIPSFDQLSNFTDNLVSMMSDTVDECASNPCLNGGTCIDGLHQYQCLCNAQHIGRNCQKSCSKSMDITFVIDGSGSIAQTGQTFDISLQIAKSIIQNLNFRYGRANVGVITFGDVPQIRFPMNKYTDQQSIINALGMMPELGMTGTSDALKYVKSHMFTSENGDRDSVENYVIVITDGYSNKDRGSTRPSAEAIRATGATIFGVGVGDPHCLDHNEIASLANAPSSQYVYLVLDEAAVDPAAQAILDMICMA